MFLGHFGLALATKRVAPKPSLGTLVLAAQLVDGVWPMFLWLFAATLVLIYFGAVFGPPPPSVRVLAMSGLPGWLFVDLGLLD